MIYKEKVLLKEVRQEPVNPSCIVHRFPVSRELAMDKVMDVINSIPKAKLVEFVLDEQVEELKSEIIYWKYKGRAEWEQSKIYEKGATKGYPHILRHYVIIYYETI